MTKNRERKLKSELELPPVLQAVKLYEPSQLTLSSSFCPENAKYLFQQILFTGKKFYLSSFDENNCQKK